MTDERKTEFGRLKKVELGLQMPDSQRIDPVVRVLAARVDGIARRVSGSADVEDRMTLERAADKLRALHFECVELRRQVLDYGDRCRQLYEGRPEQRIDPGLVERAAEAMWAHGPTTARPAWEQLSQRQREFALHEAEAVIQCVFDELGLKEERSIMVGYFSEERYVLEDGEIPDPGQEEQFRYMSDWRPVEQGDA